jgi:hypothetical protein
MNELLRRFFLHSEEAGLQFYNEQCMQMELAIFLRAQMSTCKVQLERPITDFSPVRKEGLKKEIDICILGSANELLAAVEIKYPRKQNRRIPETMFDYCKDIEFCEAIVSAGFDRAYALLVTSDEGYFSGKLKNGIYSHFRSAQTISGTIVKPTGAKNTRALIKGAYQIEWKNAFSGYRYVLIETNKA